MDWAVLFLAEPVQELSINKSKLRGKHLFRLPAAFREGLGIHFSMRLAELLLIACILRTLQAARSLARLCTCKYSAACFSLDLLCIRPQAAVSASPSSLQADRA